MTTACFKVLIVGESGVGKSSICAAYVDGNAASELSPTVGVDYKYKVIKVYQKTVKLGIWDTAGMERFKVLVPQYYRGANGVILVYDITNRNSFNKLNMWLNEVHTYAGDINIAGLVLGNKSDDEENRIVSCEEGVEFAKKHRMLFLETSAKTLQNVDLAFEELAHKIFETKRLWEHTESTLIEAEVARENCYC